MSLLLFDEVIGLEATVRDRSEVLTQVKQLAIPLEFKEKHGKSGPTETEQNLRVNVHLSAEVWRVLDSMPRAKQVVLVEAAQEEGVLTGQAERIEFVLVVAKSHGSLPEGALGRTG